MVCAVPSPCFFLGKGRVCLVSEAVHCCTLLDLKEFLVEVDITNASTTDYLER